MTSMPNADYRVEVLSNVRQIVRLDKSEFTEQEQIEAEVVSESSLLKVLFQERLIVSDSKI